MEAHTIIFIGPQGSGKGTQIEELFSYLKREDSARDVIEVQTGRGFRTLAEGSSYTAERVHDLLEHGKMVPDFLTECIVTNQLSETLTSDAHILMDGFPRNIEQAQFLDDVLAFYLREGLSVIHLDTPEDVVRARMRERGREDDTEVLINERLRLYHEMTEPLVAHYKARPGTNFVAVEGDKTIEEVQNAILAGLGLH